MTTEITPGPLPDWGTFGEHMQKALIERIDAFAKKLASELVTDYSKALEKEMARMVSNCVLEIHRLVTWERSGSELIIKVQMK